jgi:hypothetical protein
MTKPTLDELHRRHGTQHAAYLDDYLKERGGRLVTCTQCSRAYVIAARKPTQRDLAGWVCGECAPREATAMEARG